jgi:hypothetical protein
MGHAQSGLASRRLWPMTPSTVHPTGWSGNLALAGARQLPNHQCIQNNFSDQTINGYRTKPKSTSGCSSHRCFRFRPPKQRWSTTMSWCTCMPDDATNAYRCYLTTPCSQVHVTKRGSVVPHKSCSLPFGSVPGTDTFLWWNFRFWFVSSSVLQLMHV